MDRLSVTWLEIVLIMIVLLSGLGIWYIASQIYSKKLGQEILPAKIENQRVISVKEKLVRIEIERKKVLEKWANDRMTFFEEAIYLGELKTHLDTLQNDKQETIQKREKIQDTYNKAKKQHSAREQFLDHLSKHLDTLAHQESLERKELTKAEQEATKAGLPARAKLRRKQLINSFLYTGGGMLLLILITTILLKAVAHGRQTARVWIVIVGCIVGLVLLLGREMIDLVGSFGQIPVWILGIVSISILIFILIKIDIRETSSTTPP